MTNSNPKVGQQIRIKRSDGQWRDATITKIDGGIVPPFDLIQCERVDLDKRHSTIAARKYSTEGKSWHRVESTTK